MDPSRDHPDRVVLAALAVHPSSVAATRLRAVQYAEPLAERGISFRLWSFLREEDLAAWFGPSQWRRAWVLVKALLRVPAVLSVLRGADVVMVQREALPLGPPVVERFAARGRALVWDVDDAIWEPFVSPTAGRVPQWLRATGGKYRWLCAHADEVWAGSRVLAEWCSRHNSRVSVVPTVVDVPDAYPVDGPRRRTVGWVGSHSTGPFIEAALPALRRISPPPDAVIVGASPLIPSGVRAEVRPWSPAAEEQALAAMRVGLYPVDRAHPLADGKCGLKAILYMSRGIPPVVTPTPTNADVVRDGIDGLHADSAEEWAGQVQRLLDDDALWDRLSASAHERAREQYSVQVWAPQVAARVLELAGRR